MKRATIADIIRGFVPRNHVRSGVHLQLPAEESFRYSYQPNRWHPHDKIVALVGANKRVLDVGCSSGYLAKRFKENGCIVSGIERDPAAGEQARPYAM